MHHATIFEITQKPFQSWFPALGLIFVAVGFLLMKIGKKWSGHRHSTLARWGMIAFASVWTFATFYWTDSSYSNCLRAYRPGNYSIVEGPVEDFHPMPYEGHQEKCFRVQGTTFCYSDYTTRKEGYCQKMRLTGDIDGPLAVNRGVHNYCELHGFTTRISGARTVGRRASQPGRNTKVLNDGLVRHHRKLNDFLKLWKA
jgi:hypothetical protein